MRPPKTRREAFQILRRVDEAGAFASVLLEQRAATLRDPREAALLTETVLGVLRRRAQLDHAIARAADRPLETLDRAVLTAVRIGAYALLFLDRIPDFAAVDSAVTLLKEARFAKASGFANGVLRRIAREGASLLPPEPEVGDVEAMALFHSHPTWWTRRVIDRVGWDRAFALLAANNEPTATVLAPWPPGDRGAGLVDALEAEDVRVEPCRFAPEALRVLSGVPQHARVFQEGGCFVQDEASQLAVAMFGDTVGPLVLDACAAPGGKSLALAGRLVPGGLVVAADVKVKRLARLTHNVTRLNANGLVTLVADMSRPSPFARAFDDVLVDAPCSGTGTLRRHPEIRWRLTPADLARHAHKQRSLMTAVADLVRPGGRLLYSVCSMETEEGEEVVASFLAEHADFSRTAPGFGLGAAARSLLGGDLALRTSPTDGGLDGFFAALLTRRSN